MRWACLLALVAALWSCGSGGESTGTHEVWACGYCGETDDKARDCGACGESMKGVGAVVMDDRQTLD